MHNHWIFKTDPKHYSFQNLLRDRKVTWKQVRNNLAAKELRNIKNGDMIVVYHDGDERQLVGIAEAVSNPYKDTESENNPLHVIDIKPVKKLTKAVHFWEVKNNPILRSLDLAEVPELNVDSIDEKMWEEIMVLAKEKI